MDLQTLSFALAAGTFAAVNPCGFAMLPAYLTLVVLGDGREQPRRVVAVGRALAATAVMALGFVAVFGAFGLVIAPVADSVQRYLPIVTVLIGAVLIALGVGMLTGRELTVLLPKLRSGAPTARLGSMFGYGVAYAIASLSCTIGPFLAVTSASFRAGSVLGGVLAYLAYAAGMALVVGVAASAAALAGTAAINAARRLARYANRAGGAVLIIVGAYVGYYGVYELRLIFFFDQANPQDPVIEAAAAIQQKLASWLSNIGAWPLIVMLAVLVVGAVLLGTRLTRGSR